MRLFVDDTVTADLRSSLEQIDAVLTELATPSTRGSVVAVGPIDPFETSAQRPLVAVPLQAPGRQRTLTAAGTCAEVQLAFDPADADPTIDVPTVVSGLPAPKPSSAQGIDAADTEPWILEAWRGLDPGRPDPPVTWVGGGGSWTVARAVAAWRANRAVVLLPDARPSEVVVKGGALPTRSMLEVLEATSLIARTPPLSRALAARGRRVIGELPAALDVAVSVVEAAVLATEVSSRG